MNPSLSVVVPLYNVQSTLGDTVEQLLEILPELTPRFEVVLIDDGSADATLETARELSLDYPQVQVISQSVRLGVQESLRSGLRFSHGELLLLCTDRPGFDLHEICKLWNRKTDDGALWARYGRHNPLGSIPRPVTTPSSGGDGVTPDLLLVPRRLLAGWQSRGDRHDVLTYLRARGYCVQPVEIRSRRQPAGPPHPLSHVGLRSSARTPLARPERPKSVVESVGEPIRRPNLLLTKLRGLAHDQ